MATQNTGIEIENRMQRFERVDSFYNRLQNGNLETGAVIFRYLFLMIVKNKIHQNS